MCFRFGLLSLVASNLIENFKTSLLQYLARRAGKWSFRLPIFNARFVTSHFETCEITFLACCAADSISWSCKITLENNWKVTIEAIETPIQLNWQELFPWNSTCKIFPTSYRHLKKKKKKKRIFLNKSTAVSHEFHIESHVWLLYF